MWKMDPMSGFDIRLVFTLPPRDSTLQYIRWVHLWNNFPCIITLVLTLFVFRSNTDGLIFVDKRKNISPSRVSFSICIKQFNKGFISNSLRFLRRNSPVVHKPTSCFISLQIDYNWKKIAQEASARKKDKCRLPTSKYLYLVYFWYSRSSTLLQVCTCQAINLC